MYLAKDTVPSKTNGQPASHDIILVSTFTLSSFPSFIFTRAGRRRVEVSALSASNFLISGCVKV